jgi:hypothetical protein
MPGRSITSPNYAHWLSVDWSEGGADVGGVPCRRCNTKLRIFARRPPLLLKDLPNRPAVVYQLNEFSVLCPTPSTYTSNMSCENCKTGFAWEGKSTGKETTLGNNKAYVTGDNKDAAILIICDIFGWTLPNVRILADHYAKEANATVYVPDL